MVSENALKTAENYIVLFIFDLHKVQLYLERQLLKILTLLDGAAQFTVTATGVCLVIGCQHFHMKLSAKKCAL